MKSKPNKFLKDKLAQYQNDKLGKEEKDVIDNWFNAQQFVAENDFPINELAAERIALELSERLKLKLAKEKTLKLPYQWMAIACSIALIIGIVAYYRVQITPGTAAAELNDQVFHAPDGKLEKIILQDGTEIWMNAGTTLRVAANYSKSSFRKVYLDHGEAFFKVKRDTLRPFSIATKNMLTTVLGTSFNIKAYPETNIYQVAVKTGKVKVAQHEDKQWKVLSSGLIKGEVLTHHTTSGKTEIEVRNADLITNWKINRTIYADDLTLKQIAAELSRQYAIKVKVSSTGNQTRKYSLTMPHQDLKIVLQQLAFATGMNYQLTNSQLIINPPL